MGWTAESPPISRSTLDQKGEPLTEPVKHHLVLEHESQGNTIELNKSVTNQLMLFASQLSLQAVRRA